MVSEETKLKIIRGKDEFTRCEICWKRTGTTVCAICESCALKVAMEGAKRTRHLAPKYIRLWRERGLSRAGAVRLVQNTAPQVSPKTQVERSGAAYSPSAVAV